MTITILAAAVAVALLVGSFLVNRWRAPRVLIYQGRVLEERLGNSPIVSRLDLLRAVNAHGLTSLGDVEYAVLEGNGWIRVISREQAFSR
ncbi:MAG: DUF421 domain-containing protein [Acidobacteria bacterium]|nr:DUF421 domain-containing protein [Acidobacteriota bacterium]